MYFYIKNPVTHKFDVGYFDNSGSWHKDYETDIETYALLLAEHLNGGLLTGVYKRFTAITDGFEKWRVLYG